MKISVIIPFHKGLHFLADCLDSLSEQTEKDFEVLIIFSSANTLPPPSLKTQSMKFLVSPVGSPLVKNKNGL